MAINRDLRFFFKDPINRYFGLGNVALIVAGIFVLVFKMEAGSAQVLLHYTTYLGVDFIGAGYLIYLIPLGGATGAILNAILAWYAGKQDRFVAYLLMIGSALVNILLFVQIILLIRLNA